MFELFNLLLHEQLFQKCQKKDWKTHKKNCKFSSQSNSTNPSSQLVSRSAAAARSNSSWETIFDSNQMREIEQSMETYSYLIPDYAMEYKQRYPGNFDHVFKLMFERRTCIALFGRIEHGGKAFLDEDFDPKIALKRWGLTLNSKSSFDQFINREDLKVGDIWDRPVVPYATVTDILGSTFTLNYSDTLRNTPNQELVFDFGRHYVFFGYVDFSQLLWGSFQNEKEGILHFHGYDQAEVTVARSILIYEMLKSSCVKNKTILQVWFSSCWDEETKEDFENFLQTEISKIGNDLLSKHAQNWKRKKTMSIKFAQDAFVEHRRSCDFSPLDNLKSEFDRMAFARYLFTGCIFTRNDEVCGNCTMFPDRNDDWMKVPKFESFFNAIDVLNICKSLTPGHTALVDFIAKTTAQKLSKLRTLIREKKIICHLTVKSITTEDLDIASMIKELNPYLIDWSNLPDYWNRFDFLEFAEKCSGVETVHHFHTVNWVQKTFGALYYDFINNRKTLEEKFRTYMAALKRAAKMIEAASPAAVKFIRMPGFKLPTNRFTELSITTQGKHYLAHSLTTRNGNVVNHINGCLQNQFQIFENSPSTLKCMFSFDEDSLLASK